MDMIKFFTAYEDMCLKLSAALVEIEKNFIELDKRISKMELYERERQISSSKGFEDEETAKLWAFDKANEWRHDGFLTNFKVEPQDDVYMAYVKGSKIEHRPSTDWK